MAGAGARCLWKQPSRLEESATPAGRRLPRLSAAQVKAAARMYDILGADIHLRRVWRATSRRHPADVSFAAFSPVFAARLAAIGGIPSAVSPGDLCRWTETMS